MTDGNDEVLSEAALDAPHVRAFLPMLYVAWADGELVALGRPPGRGVNGVHERRGWRHQTWC